MTINENNKVEIKNPLKLFFKQSNLELHEIFSYIGVALMRNKNASKLLCTNTCYFMYHLVEFLMEIKKDKLVIDLEKAKVKGSRDESIYIYISIVDNTILCLDSLINMDYESKTYFIDLLKYMNVTKSQFRFQIVDIMHLFGTTFNFTNEKLRKCFANFKENLDAI